MKRSADIRDKLAFTLVKYQELSTNVSAAQKSEGEVPYLAQKVGDILSGCRECFDYCAKDIADRFIATSPNQKLAIRYVAGKEKAYFPFFLKQLSSGNLFFDLSNSNPRLYADLSDLAIKIEANEVIPNTVCTYGLAVELSELVNSKKHDKITSTQARPNAATRVAFPGGTEITVSPMFQFNGAVPDFAADVDAQPMIGTPGVEIKYVREFKLVDNNWEVTRYCLHAIRTTTSILTEIYSKHFGTAIDYFDPWETTKPEKVRMAEAVVKAISPIASHPVLVALLLDEKEVFKTDISFDGSPTATDDSAIALANLFAISFERFYLQRHISELIKCIHDDPPFVDYSDFSPRYSELTIPLSSKKDIVINGDTAVSFNKIILGIGTKFCCVGKFEAPTIDNDSLAAIHAITESQILRFDLRTDKQGKILNCTILD